jgi:hypothetical protein
VVEHQMEKGSIMMPEVQAPTLSAVLREAAVNDKEYFFELFDLLYQKIDDWANPKQYENKRMMAKF